MAEHNIVGKIGEDLAERFLRQKGVEIVKRNFRKPYGEIDIVARENNLLCFIEVKTVSYETGGIGDPTVSRGTGYRPEENVHPQKILRLSRVIQAYLAARQSDEAWRFDVMTVYIDQRTKQAKIKWLKDIILS